VKQKPKKEEALLPLDVTGTFHTVVKSSHLLYEAIEISVHMGIVIGIKVLSRAPDLAQAAVGICSREIWNNLRTHEKEKVLPDE